ncbi:DUF6597 domain-containing transcriptional factor [Halarcobacter anaerophilus]|uniref:DUF6597 domain-containing transcriptional factor n=1 Tax=Halarcobacter anaerophilus TaxID=877500 RepID=UPI0005C88B2F|nr:DUF6597 domain-containing transcriptional factor [Halarcobacter anaerophilus]
MYSSKMFLPDYRLKEWIKVYWFLEGKGVGNNSYLRHILPDGCATIVFVLDGEMNLSSYINGTLKRGIHIVPPVVSPHYDIIRDDIHFIDVQLNPSVFYKLFNFPVSEFENKLYDFKDISIKFDESIIEKLYEVKNNNAEIYKLLNNFFLDLFSQKDFYADELIYNINELYRVGDLDKFYKEQKLSIRQLERKVKDFTGLTPKNLSRIGRFYSILDFMKFRQFNIEFSELAFEYNFSDQSHFIREFKYFSRTTPSKFIKHMNNFPQIKGLCNLTKTSEDKNF